MKVCEVCKAQPAKVDGKTRFGFWAYMCFNCHKLLGIGLGEGKGQELAGKDAK